MDTVNTILLSLIVFFGSLFLLILFRGITTKYKDDELCECGHKRVEHKESIKFLMPSIIFGVENQLQCEKYGCTCNKFRMKILEKANNHQTEI